MYCWLLSSRLSFPEIGVKLMGYFNKYFRVTLFNALEGRGAQVRLTRNSGINPSYINNIIKNCKLRFGGDPSSSGNYSGIFRPLLRRFS